MRPLSDVTVTAGETATFECELSYEGIEVQWFLGGQKMEASDRVSPVVSLHQNLFTENSQIDSSDRRKIDFRKQKDNILI